MNNKSEVAGVFSTVALVLVISIITLVIWVRRRRARLALGSVFPFINRTEASRTDGSHRVENHVFDIMPRSPVHFRSEKSSKVGTNRNEKPSVL